MLSIKNKHVAMSSIMVICDILNCNIFHSFKVVTFQQAPLLRISFRIKLVTDGGFTKSAALVAMK